MGIGPIVGAPAQRVAVIAVHGVGYTTPGATAQHLADLLLGLGRLKLDQQTDWPPPDSPPPYRTFEKSPVAIGLRSPYLSEAGRAQARDRVSDFVGRRLLHIFDERLGYLARAFARVTPAAQVEQEVRDDPGKIAQEFMRVQLASYVGSPEGQAFDTVCLEGERNEAGRPPVTVHVYESYWADLARPSNNFISFFMAFYQLLFHLSSLSRTAVYYAALEHMTDWRWRVVSFLQAFASRVLVLPIPILNLILLVTGLSVLTCKIPLANQRLAATVIAALFALVAIALIRKVSAVAARPWQWLTYLLIVAGGGAAIGFFVGSSQSRAAGVLAIEWWVLGSALLFELLERYNVVRRTALTTGVVLLVLSFLAFCSCLFVASDFPSPVEQASFWTIQLIMGALVVCWVALLLSALALWLFNGICLYGKKARALRQAERARARAALRTGRLTLSVSASVFLLATIFLWSGFFGFATDKWSLYSSVQPSPPPLGDTIGKAFAYLVPDPDLARCWIGRIGYAAPKPGLFSDDVRALLLIGTTSGLPVMLGLSAPALIILFLMVLPSLLVPRSKLYKATNVQANILGNWYSCGLDATKVVATLLWHSIFTATLVFGALDFLYLHSLETNLPADWLWTFLRWNSLHTLQMEDLAAGTLAVSGVALAALALKYGKAPLDIILDVDNYLRTSPLNNTPRGRIAERYVSILRYIALRNNPDGSPYYRSIVIGAHSLGALISVDLLHYLRREGDPDLQRLGLWPPESDHAPNIAISLLTFGNPLRQLLNRFFPHLYWWVNATPDNSISPLPSGAGTAAQVTQLNTPTLLGLRLARWVNAYRSGDFVGRSVWLNNWYRRNDDGDARGQYPSAARAFPTVANGTELCIGEGAHNDYWNRSAPDIAQRLDFLIAG
jgi:hypothetical protein